jgi:hypothetical protein
MFDQRLVLFYQSPLKLGGCLEPGYAILESLFVERVKSFVRTQAINRKIKQSFIDDIRETPILAGCRVCHNPRQTPVDCGINFTPFRRNYGVA